MSPCDRSSLSGTLAGALRNPPDGEARTAGSSMEQCESESSLLASMHEQEVQFERLTRALEEERRRGGPPSPVPRPFLAPNGRVAGDLAIERLKLNEAYINGTQYGMLDPGHIVEETYTVEEDPQETPSVVSNEGGTTRRMEITVKKVGQMFSTRRSVDGGGSVLEGGGYAATLDHLYRPNGAGDYPTATVPRNYHYSPARSYHDYQPTSPSNGYASLTRGVRVDERYGRVREYRTLDSGYRAASRPQKARNGAQPQVRTGSALELQRFSHQRHTPEDDQRSLGYEDIPYSAGQPPTYATYSTYSTVERRRLRSREDTLDGDLGSEPYWPGTAPLAQMQRGSMASLNSTLRKGAPPTSWRQPELPEVIAMLNNRLDPVKSNAAAFLQHLTFKNDKVKSEVRRLKGIPALVSLLDNPKKEVHHAACGALKNISYGRDHDNKIAIKNCDGIPALVRLLRKASDQDLTDTITGTLWNLSSQDSVKMEIVDHALHALSDEMLVPRSGWQGGGGEEGGKPKHLEWETALTNTAGCLRNVSSERSEARRKLRECTGLVDSLMHIIQSQISHKDVDSKLVENCVCLLRNLSYQVHREVPGCERYQEALTPEQGSIPESAHKASCFGSRNGKDEWSSKGRRDAADTTTDLIDFPKRTTPAEGYELLFQPEVVHVYTALLRDSKNPSVLEAAAGAIQNLCAGRWTYGRYIRAMVRQVKGLEMMTELLAHGNDRVVNSMSGALRNLAIDSRNRELLGKHAVPHLVANLPAAGQQHPVRALSVETVLSVLSTLAEVLGSNVEAAKTLRAAQGVERLVLINKNGERSEKEVRGAGQVLQIIWAHKALRRLLQKDGWKKTDFMVNLSGPTSSCSSAATDEDSTLPLISQGV